MRVSKYLLPGIIAALSCVVIGASLQLDTSPPMIVGKAMQPRAYPIFLMLLNLLLVAALTLQLHKAPADPPPAESYHTWGTLLLLVLFYPLTVWLATIGAEKATGIERFMFGNYDLYEGLAFVPVFIGLFAISELLVQSRHVNRILETIALKAVQLPTMADYKKIWKTILRSCGIGTFIGILPAEGATVASMIGYSEARRWSKHKEEFGKGAVEGIAGAEAANNAATGGAMVPTMVLGIPGSGTTAIILVGLLVHGLRPGPYLFTEQVDTVYQIFGAMLIANFMFLLMGLYAAKLFARITLVPTAILWPIVFALSVIGAYSLNASLLDVWIALIFGVIGFVARRYKFSVAPIAVGLILGEMVETNLQNTLKMFEGQWWLIFTQPLAVLFLVLAFLGLCGPFIYERLFGKRGDVGEPEGAAR
jgi:putative tricarboxylic transport membrane protein